jgi:hypothetical protein
MSNVSGTISVNVEFRDTTTSIGVQSLKTVTLREATEYTTGKVAIVTGTVGTASATISFNSTAYKNAAGSAVSFSQVQRLAFSASPLAFLDVAAALGGGDAVLVSRQNEATLVDARQSGSANVYTTAGTASYTLVLYGT